MEWRWRRGEESKGEEDVILELELELGKAGRFYRSQNFGEGGGNLLLD